MSKPKTKFNLWKKWQKQHLRTISKPHAYLQTMNKTPMKFWKNRHKTVGGVAHTRNPLSIHFDSKNAEKMTKFNLWKKWWKDLRTISKPHAYLQTTTKTSVKFRKNLHKTVGGVAHTRYPLSIHFDSKNAEKMTKFNLWQKWQEIIWGLNPNHMHIFRPWQKHLWSFERIGT